jgi:hypothetical protein
MAVKEIEYLDVNLAADWLFSHPENPKSVVSQVQPT